MSIAHRTSKGFPTNTDTHYEMDRQIGNGLCASIPGRISSFRPISEYLNASEIWETNTLHLEACQQSM